MKHLGEHLTKPWLNRAGSLIGVVGAGFVGVKLWEYSDQLANVDLGFPAYVALVVLAIGYGLSNLLLGLAWGHLLAHLGFPVATNWALRIYGLSQLGKYVPGNIFQFAGRQVLGVASGLPNWPLVKSSALELVLLGSGGLMFALLLAGLWLDLSGDASATASTALFTVAGAVSLYLANRLASGRIACALGCYYVFLGISGGGFAAIFALSDDAVTGIATLPVVAGAYVVAWLAGLVTPGAPAGLGIREAVLLYLLSGMSSDANILIAVLMGRAVTVGGDFVFYMCARLMPRSGSSAFG